jgi:hypothetical protein
VTGERDLPTADELLERRSAKRRIQMMDIAESFAVQAETAPTVRLRAAFASRYAGLIGVPPARRHALRASLQDLGQSTVEELLARYSRPDD